MHLEDVAKHLERRAQERDLVYLLRDATTAPDIVRAEARLQVIFPAQLRQFYQHYDGLQIELPPLDVFAVQQLAYIAPQKLHFAMVDRQHCLCFDTSHINEAGQWDIIAFPSGYRVTMTMASFWSNKLWAWIDRRRTIWQPETRD